MYHNQKDNSGQATGQNSQSYPAVNPCDTTKQPIKSNKWNAQLTCRFIMGENQKRFWMLECANQPFMGGRGGDAECPSNQLIHIFHNAVNLFLFKLQNQWAICSRSWSHNYVMTLNNIQRKGENMRTFTQDPNKQTQTSPRGYLMLGFSSFIKVMAKLMTKILQIIKLRLVINCL